MGVWYERSFRRNLIDMHIEDWNDEFLSRFDPEDYFANLQLANVASPMIYIQSHVGHCYWPTTSGHMHRAFEGREDAMRRLFGLCHGAGMDVIAYYSLIYNNWAYDKFPDSRMRTSSGLGSRDNGSRYGLLCPNNEAYRSFVATQIAEFAQYFSFEAVFFDMTFWPMVCYCDSCKARWAREVGGDMPTVIDWKGDRWLLFQEKRQEWLGEFARFATTEMKKHKPQCAVEHQYSTAMHFWRFGVNENIAKASDYAGGDLYGGLAEQSFACKLYYNSTPSQPFEYMTSRCHPNLQEHTTTKSTELLSLDVMTTLFHHGACVMIDAIDPRGTIDRRVYERLGIAYRDAKKFEPWIKGNLVQDVGIYYNLNGKMDCERNGVAVGSAEAENQDQPHQRAALGAANSLREHHIPFGVIPGWRPELFDSVSVLALCDVPLMSPSEEKAVRDFVANGGKLYLSGHSATRLVEEVFGVRIAGETEEMMTYMTPTESGATVMPGYTRDYPLALSFQQATVQGFPRGEVLANVTLPYTVPLQGHVPGAMIGRSTALSREEYEKRRRFASIHSDPPGRVTREPAILRAGFGRGMVVWAAAPIEAAGRTPHSDVFAAIIRSLGGAFSLSSDAPAAVEFILSNVATGGRRCLGILNLQDSFHPIPIGAFSVSVRTGSRPAGVQFVPERVVLPFTFSEGITTFTVPSLELYRLVEITG